MTTVMYNVQGTGVLYSRDWYPCSNSYQQDYVPIIHAVLVLHYGNEAWNTLQAIFGSTYGQQLSSLFFYENRPCFSKCN